MRKYDGICDKCGQLSGPHVIDGQWMCPDCTQALVDQLRARVEKLRRYLDGREKAILARIAAEELAGNTVQEDMERTALAEIREIQTLLLSESLQSEGG